jgi:hypothetical protein
MQADSARQPGQFTNQHLIGKRFATKLPIGVFELRNRQFLALHGVPLAVVVAEKSKPVDLIYYDRLMTLPAGTVLEMVGEMRWSASPIAANAPQGQTFTFFITHGPPAANDLLLPLPASLLDAGLRGQALRAHGAVDFPEAFLAEVNVPSQWTQARRDLIEHAHWHAGIGLDLSQLAVPPARDRGASWTR